MNRLPRTPLTSDSDDADQHRIEQCVDKLSELARSDIEPGPFFGETLSCLRQFGSVQSARLWRKDVAGNWDIAGQWPTEPNPQPDRRANDDLWLTETAAARQCSIRTGNSGHSGNVVTATRILGPIVHSGQTVALLDATHEGVLVADEQSDACQFLNAIAEIAADYLSLSELRQLRSARSQWQQWDQFTVGLMRITDLQRLAAMIVNDGRLLVECDRLTLLHRVNSGFATVGVTGVDRVESRSNSVRALESVARHVTTVNRSAWFNSHSSGSDVDTTFASDLAEYARLTNVRASGLIPITSTSVDSGVTSNNAEQNVVRAVLVVEQFRDVSDFAAWRSRSELLARRCEPQLNAVLDRESIPFLKLMQQLRRVPLWLRRPGVRMGLLASPFLIAVLTFVPAEFTVTGKAELVPDVRREIFASSSGIVDRVFVKHGDIVEADQPLVSLHDPQLALDLPKISGEIDVVRERLRGVLASRLAGGSTPDAANRARQLTADEEELKERQRSLERQRNLIEQQQASLMLRSPIRGKVLTWDVATLLSARPVERGQVLLTVGDTDGPWVIEMRIPDKDFGHVRNGRQRLKPNLDVDFLVASDHRHSYRGTIRDVAETTQFDDQIGNCVAITVTIEEAPSGDRRAGTSVISRIRCGKRAIGYVWLHDLIDAIRTRLIW